MNYQELVEKIKEIGIEKIGNGDFTINDINLIETHSIGGTEGEGEYAEIVYLHSNDTESIYVKITGYYSSYEGITWDEIHQVSPIQKTITVYE